MYIALQQKKPNRSVVIATRQQQKPPVRFQQPKQYSFAKLNAKLSPVKTKMIENLNSIVKETIFWHSLIIFPVNVKYLQLFFTLINWPISGLVVRIHGQTDFALQKSGKNRRFARHHLHQCQCNKIVWSDFRYCNGTVFCANNVGQIRLLRNDMAPLTTMTG
jgi:hypothetical protein